MIVFPKKKKGCRERFQRRSREKFQKKELAKVRK
jgi:hypothetical protein